MYDIIIIGAGPAGLTAGIYAKRSGKKTLILEAKNYGGQIINAKSIENYPAEINISGFDFSTNLYNQAKNLGNDILFEEVTEIINTSNHKQVITTKNNYITKSIIIATGLTKRTLNLPNTNSLIGRGISYCATCDGFFFKNQEVAVLGGGSSAISEALYLSDIAKKVYLIHRKNDFKAPEIMTKKLKTKKNIIIIKNSTIEKLNSKNKLTSIEIKSNNKMKTINVTGLFIAIGQIPNNDIFKKIIKTDKNGYISAGEDCKTNVEGIFVAGDTRTKQLRQLVTATSDGAIAADNAVKYINTINEIK